MRQDTQVLLAGMVPRFDDSIASAASYLILVLVLVVIVCESIGPLLSAFDSGPMS